MEREVNLQIVSHSSLREFANDGDALDKYYLPARGLTLKADRYLLPEYGPLLDYANQLNTILKSLNLQERRIIFIPDVDYLLDIAIFQNISLLKEKLDKNLPYRVYPYAITDETLSWINNLNRNGLNIKPAFPKKVYFDDLYHPAHRGGWGRWIGKEDRPSFPEKFNLPYPVSWIGQGIEQIIEAYRRVCQDSGQSKTFFKPIFSAGGFTLAEIQSTEELIQHYNKLKAQDALSFDGKETPVEIQEFIPDIVSIHSLQYDETGNLLTPRSISEQIVKNNQWQGNFFNGFEIVPEIREIWKNFKKGYQKYLGNPNFGWGGIDMVLTKNRGWIILEHNGLRITGAHPAILLANQLEVAEQPFMTLKSPGEVNSDLQTIWSLLTTENLSFNPVTRKGIFPIVWFPGSGMLFATGENPRKLLEEAYNLFAKNWYISNNQR
jgi:hypothetical protein